MAKQIKQINQDLQGIETQVLALSEELKRIYAVYIDHLGTTVRKELVLAVFNLCTQVAPTDFLALSVRDREKLQQQLRRLVRDWQKAIPALVSSPEMIDPELAAEQMQAVKSMVEETPLSEVARKVPAALSIEFTIPSAKADKTELLPPLPFVAKGAPQTLMIWCEILELRMDSVLLYLSRVVNRELYERKILVDKVPFKVYGIAIAAAESKTPSSLAPHLLSLMVEENKDDQKESIAKITAIRLRLSELEYASPALSSARQQIRQLAGGLGKLNKQYQKFQQELTIAEAETAWRSLWFEEPDS
ncbi:MAG: hypothetical protein AAGG02_03025 [Cyanobacteria bacterium P01_H01_bin.15]